MGICYQGRTLKQAVAEKESSFKETGYAYGLRDLKLVTDDPAKFMRFQLRLVAACINARETAKLISANPVAMLQGELLFMLATPEGDCVAASYGLAGHIQAFPFIVKSIANLDFEEDPTIEIGDVFATNDAYYGAPHNADNYNWVPVFYKGELIAWTVGLNHIVDVRVGASQLLRLRVDPINHLRFRDLVKRREGRRVGGAERHLNRESKHALRVHIVRASDGAVDFLHHVRQVTLLMNAARIDSGCVLGSHD